MLTEEGVIEKVTQDKAYVRITRNSACAGCQSHGACRPSESKEMVVEALNQVQGKVGDHVRISLPTRSFLKVAFLVYFLPVVALVAGAAMGNGMAPNFNLDPTLTSIGAGGLSMAATFGVVKWFDRGAQAKQEYWPRITRILPGSDPPPACNK